ncbi:MAG: antirestriction protein, partial [Rhizobiales bacterium 32-66-8]
MTDAAITSSPPTLVPEARRIAFLPALFGPPLMLIGERAVYQFMSWLAPDDYTGGLWLFHEQGGQPLFLSPATDKRFRLF